MAELFNFAQNRYEEISDDLVTDAIKSGSHGLRKGVPINIFDRDGNAFSVPAEDARGEFLQGSTFANKSQIEAFKKRKEARESPIEATALGLGRSLTLGFTDVVAKGTGFRTQEELDLLSEENPVLTGLSETIGIAGPILLSGGSSLLAKGLTKAGIAVLGAEAAGQAVGKVVSKKIANETLREFVGRGAGFGAEALGLSAAQILSRRAFNDENRPMTAEALVAEIGTNAVLGAALGAGSALIRPGAKAFKKQVLDRARQIIPEGPDKTRVMSFITGQSEEVINKFGLRPLEIDAAQTISQTALNIEQQLVMLTDKSSQQHRVVLEALDQSGIGLNKQAIVKVLSKNKDRIKALKGKGVVALSIKKEAKKLDAIIKQVEDINTFNGVAHNPFLPGQELIGANPVKQVVEAMDDILTNTFNKRKVNKILEKGEAELLITRGKLNQELRDAVPEFAELMNAHAETTSLVNDLSQIIGNKNLSEGKLKTIVTSLQERRPTKKTSVDVLRRLRIETSTNASKLNEIGISKQVFDEAKKNLDGFDAIQMIDDRLILDKMNASTTAGSRKSLVGATVGSMVGGVSAGPIGAAIGAVGGATMDQFGGKFVKEIIKMQALIGSPLKAMTEVAERYTKKVDSVMSTSIKNAGRAIKTESIRRLTKSRLTEKDENEIIDLINTKSSNIEIEIERFQNRNSLMFDAEPDTSLLMSNKLVDLIAFLQSKNFKSGGQFALDKSRMSERQRIKFKTYIAAAENQDIIFDSLKDGLVIPEHIEILEAVYPATFERMQEKLIEEMSDLEKDISRKAANALSKVFKVPLLTSQSPQFTQMVQALIMGEREQNRQQREQGRQRLKTAKLPKLSKIGQSKSQSDKIIEGTS